MWTTDGMRYRTVDVMSDKPFGSCCESLQRAMAQPHALIRVETNGVLYLSVGYVNIESGGVGWFDQAVRFCPFCGTALQTAESILASKGSRTN